MTRTEQETAESPTFEESLAKLETIVRQLEDGSLGLTDSLARYEEGIQCLKRCHEALEIVERRVEFVTGVTADGTPVVAPFEEGDLSLEEKAAARSRRRSKGESAGDEPKRKPKPAGTTEGESDEGAAGRRLF
jgi:exodeoxyribonuclease VII small subunit